MERPMTPEQYRALAARVETEEPSDALGDAVLVAYGWQRRRDNVWVSPDGQLFYRKPLPLYSRDAAAGLMPEGWRVLTMHGEWDGSYDIMLEESGHDDVWVIAQGKAPTEPRARAAAALRARAAGMEAANG